MITFKVENKIINIYQEESYPVSSLPVVIYNNVEGTGEDLWQTCATLKCAPFILVNISNINWNQEMTPWKDLEYEGKANCYIEELTKKIIPQIERALDGKPAYYIIAGYSLGGLFALYSLYKTDCFKKAVSISGSLWYPHLIDFIQNNQMIRVPQKIYLSLGNQEKNTKNEILKQVQEKTETIYQFYKSQKMNIIYELNEGGHFKDGNIRVAKGIKKTLED